jgi:hypothetical protein
VCENYLIINFANELIKIGEKLDDKLQWNGKSNSRPK